MGRTSAETTPNDANPALRGRTYSIPFEDVWNGALRLAQGGMKGWSVESADDQEGRLVAHVQGWRKKLHGVVDVTITLDQDGQTRVDAQAVTPQTARDWGVNARRLARFFEELDRAAARELARRRGASSAAA